ncbi:hypothetical protein QIA36_04900 (plasmid) [Borreliella yangtzensis]
MNNKNNKLIMFLFFNIFLIINMRENILQYYKNTGPISNIKLPININPMIFISLRASELQNNLNN